jgi:hypothetical protein
MPGTLTPPVLSAGADVQGQHTKWELSFDGGTTWHETCSRTTGLIQMSNARVAKAPNQCSGNQEEFVLGIGTWNAAPTFQVKKNDAVYKGLRNAAVNRTTVRVWQVSPNDTAEGNMNVMNWGLVEAGKYDSVTISPDMQGNGTLTVTDVA